MTRVIGGFLKGRKLSTPEGMDTRPTMDRTKEALFGSIQFDVPQCRFLDLFAGSGGIGIEAVSRGAASLDLVEKDPRAIRVIRQNLKDLGIENCSRLWTQDVEKALVLLEESHRQFDIIFMDPPYHKGFEEKIGTLVAAGSLLADSGMLIIESSTETDFMLPKMECFKVKTYKTAKFSFFRKQPEGAL